MAPDERSYRLSPRARQDLEQIWLYTFERWSQTQADDYFVELTMAFEALAKGHRKGKPIDGVRRGYLSLACGSHFIIYHELGSKAEIIRILHQRMNIGRHL